jgi:hypothetical protein
MSSLTDFFNPFLCNQGIGNVAKETEDKVKRHGVKGFKASKDDGVKGSFVSAESMSLLLNQSSLTDLLNDLSAIRVSETSRRKRRTRSSAMV